MSESYCDRFLPSDGIYLLNHSVGRPPVTVREAWSQGFMEPWEAGGEAVWPRWLAAVEDFRSALARLLHSQTGSFCPQVNLSSALTKILQAVSLPAPRTTILYCEEDFPSMGYVLQQAQRLGYRLRALPADLDPLDASHWSGQLDDEVGLVLVTHVHSNTSMQVPVADITALARSRGILSVVDIAQSVGCVPIDLRTWQADFVIGSCVKWLCGGPGAGFLWVDSSRLAECEPLDVGWFSHQDPFEFDIHDFRYADDALRFWGGTPSVQPYVLAAHSIGVLCDIGIDRIRAHNLGLTGRILDAVDPNHRATPREASRRGGTVVLRYPAPLQAEICERLEAARVEFDVRPTGIRLSPHIYNQGDEVTTLLECLA